MEQNQVEIAAKPPAAHHYHADRSAEPAAIHAGPAALDARGQEGDEILGGHRAGNAHGPIDLPNRDRKDGDGQNGASSRSLRTPIGIPVQGSPANKQSQNQGSPPYGKPAFTR